MSQAPPIAFYAPLKSPDAPSPSGDRTMARLLLVALGEAGFAPALASRLRTLDLAGNDSAQRAIADASHREAGRLLGHWRDHPHERPALWFTYHCYYKAPDWLGPMVARALGIPYVVAEASRAPKRADGPHAFSHRGAEAAIDAAAIVFSMTAKDRAALEAARPAGQSIVDLPPFIAAAGPAPAPRIPGPTLRLLTVAMTREGDKLASYRLLFEALTRLADLDWRLDIAGDGPARATIDAMAAPFGERVRMHGLIEAPELLAAFYREADLFVWPAVNEAYGMVFLEALAAGCPVVAGREGGVASVVADSVDGILVPPRDMAAFAAAIRALAADPARRAAMGAAGRARIAARHTLPAAAATLRAALLPLIGAGPCA